MKYLFNIILALFLISVAAIVACADTARPEDIKVKLKDPCDTFIVKKDTMVEVTDTLYVNPGDTLGTDTIFPND